MTPTPVRPELRDGVAWALDQGWALIPMRPDSKKPRIKTGANHHLAISDPEQVAGWIIQGVEAFAIRTGTFDDYAGPTVFDRDDLTIEPPGALPASVVVTTGRDGGGEHHYFTAPPLRGTAHRASGQVKSQGGYALCPGSRHPSGRVYGFATRRRTPAAAPAWLVEMCQAPIERPADTTVDFDGTVTAYARATLEALVDELTTADTGWNTTLNTAAFRINQLIAGGQIGEDALDELREAAAPRTEADATMMEDTMRSALAGRANPLHADVFEIEIDTDDEECDEETPDALVEMEIRRLLARHRAGEIIAEQQAVRVWTPPQSTSARDLVQHTAHEVVEWTIEGLHQVGANSMCAAQFKTGKTTLALNLLRSLADGVPFVGQAVRQPRGRIGVWNMEMSDGQFTNWLRDIGIEHLDRIEVLNLRGRSLPLYSELVREWTAKWLVDHDITSWLIDPLARVVAGWPGTANPESSNAVADAFAGHVDDLKESVGVDDLFIMSHTQRAAESPDVQLRTRGASRWDEWPDSLWRMRRTRDGKRVLWALGRDVEIEEREVTYDADTRRVSVGLTGGGIERQLRSASDAEQFYAEVERIPGRSQNDYMGRLGFAKQRMKATVEVAVESGLVLVEPGPNKSKRFFPAPGVIDMP